MTSLSVDPRAAQGAALPLDPAGLHAAARRLAEIAVAAGHAIMRIYAASVEAERKADGSPLTAADLAGEAGIAGGGGPGVSGGPGLSTTGKGGVGGKGESRGGRSNLKK